MTTVIDENQINVKIERKYNKKKTNFSNSITLLIFNFENIFFLF